MRSLVAMGFGLVWAAFVHADQGLCQQNVFGSQAEAHVPLALRPSVAQELLWQQSLDRLQNEYLPKRNSQVLAQIMADFARATLSELKKFDRRRLAQGLQAYLDRDYQQKGYVRGGSMTDTSDGDEMDSYQALIVNFLSWRQGSSSSSDRFGQAWAQIASVAQSRRDLALSKAPRVDREQVTVLLETYMRAFSHYAWWEIARQSLCHGEMGVTIVQPGLRNHYEQTVSSHECQHHTLCQRKPLDLHESMMPMVH